MANRLEKIVEHLISQGIDSETAQACAEAFIEADEKMEAEYGKGWDK